MTIIRESSENSEFVTIKLPKSVGAHNAAKIFADCVVMCGGSVPKHIRFDMQYMDRITPAGVTFLSNLGLWYYNRGYIVHFLVPADRNQAALFLDQCNFFLVHCGRKITEAAPIQTLMPLQKIRQEQSHMWLRGVFVPWLAAQLNVNEEALGELQTCLSELFNNIADHSQQVEGSIFAQHNPEQRQVVISISDFGIGIPEMIRTVKSGLTDSQAICQAVERGFTTKTTPKNRGEGLAYLLDNAVLRYQGKVTVMSGRGIVTFRNRDGRIRPSVNVGNYYCPGTLFDIVLRTSTIENVEQTRMDLEW